MATQSDIQKLRTMMKRKGYSGFFLGVALATGLLAGAIHGLVNPEIANSTFGHSVELIALHNTLLDLRNLSGGVAVISFLISMFMDQSVQDLAQ